MEKRVFLVDATHLEYKLGDKELYNDFEDHYPLSEVPSVHYLNIGRGSEIFLPVTLFANSTTPFQSIVRYLKENKGFRNNKIAKLLSRETRTIWAAYSSIKGKNILKIQPTSIMIPLSIFCNSNLSILESLTDYLQGLGFSYAEISRLIGRDQRTVWTVHYRARRKFIKKNGTQ